MEGKRTKQSQGEHIKDGHKLGGNFTSQANPAFVDTRLKLFTQIKKRVEEAYNAVDKPEITITLKDGKQIKGQAFVSTPLSIAAGISKKLAEATVVARVHYSKRLDFKFSKACVSAEVEEQAEEKKQDGELIDLTRPLEGDCVLELLNFDDAKGKEVFWHSSAHLLGQALEQQYGAWLCHGPPLAKGFFYDSYIGKHKISQGDYEKIEGDIKKFVLEKQPFERIVLTKAEALDMFADNPFKVQLIQAKVPEEGYTSAYKCGKLIDLCTGPHVQSSDKIKGFKVTKNSSAYWLADKNNDDLQRVYAISFPKQAQLDEYVKEEEELAKRDHRSIGPKQGLFNFSPLAPGCAFFFPEGAKIYNRLTNLMRDEYRIRGYQEVITPNMYNQELWKISGHFFKYKDNMYLINQDDQIHGLKPMNCPGHCLMFDMIQRSYRDLPIRFADFGVLHRNEVHGALSGLTRVRRFQQDDAHIFCMPDQIESEILAVLDFLDYVYSLFEFKYKLELSTRPDEFLGRIEDWDKAEQQLENALKQFGKEYKVNPKDGAFYGPKIDVKLFDAFGREHQCGTVQLDFQLPLRFDLQYRHKGEAQEPKKKEEHHQEKEKGQDKKNKGKKQKKEDREHKHEEIKKEETEVDKSKEDEAKDVKVEEKQKNVKAEKKPKNANVKAEQKKDDQKKEECNHDCKLHQHEQVEELDPITAQKAKYDKIAELRNGFSRPVIIHRAILGSLERLIGILCEHTGGKWPFWLSPRQIILLPIGKDDRVFAQAVYDRLLVQGYNVSIDLSGDKLPKMIRDAQVEGFNYIAVIGKDEVEHQYVDLRDGEKSEQLGKYAIYKLLDLFKSLSPPKSKRRIEMENKAAKV